MICVSVVQRKKDLTAVEGHIVLLEYLEERPLLLSRPGMHLAHREPHTVSDRMRQ